jgi:pimeloyl-ACP methyl ester esterase
VPWYENDRKNRLWYEDQGVGPVIVLVHGWCKSSAVWRFQLDALSKYFRVIAPDLAGYGKSGCPADEIDLYGYAADLVALFNALKLENTLLVGWSQGAQIVLQASLALHERLWGIVLVSGTPRFTSSVDFPHGLSETEANGMANKVKRNLGRALAGFNAHMFAEDELENATNGEQILELLSSEPLPETGIAIQGLKALYKADLRSILRKIKLPTLIINGNQDQICLPGASSFFAENISESRHVIFSGCGHAPFLSHAADFNNCISEFFRGNSDFVR